MPAMARGSYVHVAAVAPVEFHEGDIAGSPPALRADAHLWLEPQFIHHIVDDLGHGPQGQVDQ